MYLINAKHFRLESDFWIFLIQCIHLINLLLTQLHRQAAKHFLTARCLSKCDRFYGQCPFTSDRAFNLQDKQFELLGRYLYA